MAANRSEFLDIVMRAKEPDVCFGWHNRIIENPNPTDDVRFDLPSTRFRALIVAETGGRRFQRLVRVVNDAGFDHCRLEDIGSGVGIVNPDVLGI